MHTLIKKINDVNTTQILRQYERKHHGLHALRPHARERLGQHRSGIRRYRSNLGGLQLQRIDALIAIRASTLWNSA